jgi:hypothetical protein
MENIVLINITCKALSLPRLRLRVKLFYALETSLEATCSSIISILFAKFVSICFQRSKFDYLQRELRNYLTADFIV